MQEDPEKRNSDFFSAAIGDAFLDLDRQNRSTALFWVWIGPPCLVLLPSTWILSFFVE